MAQLRHHRPSARRTRPTEVGVMRGGSGSTPMWSSIWRMSEVDGFAWSDDAELANPRTQATLKRLRKAMADIQAEIEAHHGVYPYNHERVTQSELCRRADVKKATLQTPLHKEATREQVTAVADEWNAEVE